LVRIFSDQFQSFWLDVINLAAIIYNSVPRPQLLNHSPHYMMFQKEPFQNHELFQNVEENLNLESYLSRTLNDKIYIKLLRERLLKIHEKQNKLKSKRFLSYPVGSVILVRDNRPKANKKLKPIFYKLPQKIIT